MCIRDRDNGYIPVASTGAYSGSKPSGKISIGGSSSVTPVMEKLKEAYNAVNPNATIEINMTDSSSGMTSAAEGVCDIGMASREVKQSELDKGLDVYKRQLRFLGSFCKTKRQKSEM